MTVWFTSDPHVGHHLVAKKRGFVTPDQHDEWLDEAFRSRLRKDDVTWWLGDLAASTPTDALAWISTLPGRHHLITGNHDKVFPHHRDSHRFQRQYLEVFGSVQAYARRRIDGHEVLLSHFPYLGEGDDHTEEARYTQYRLPDEGRWLLHGHTHMATQQVHGHQIHVGLDAWRRPVSLEEIVDIIEERA